MNSIVNCAAYANGRRVAKVDLDDVKQVLSQPEMFVWVGLHEPSEEILAKIKVEFDLHELAVEDAHLAHQRPKVEKYGDSLFIVLRTAQTNQGNHIDFGETHFFLGSNFIVTIRHGSSLAYTEVRERCEKSPHLLEKGPAFSLYALVNSIIDQYYPVIDTLERQLEQMEEKIFAEKARRETIEEIYMLKREMLEVKHAVSPLIDICNRLMRYDLTLIPEDTRPYFRDLYDHAARINEMIDSLRELLNSALDANFSMLSISQNETSKKFAAWAAIIAVPTMVAGIYGMNFEFIPELHWHYGYPVVLTLTIGTCISLYVVFRRSGWL